MGLDLIMRIRIVRMWWRLFNDIIFFFCFFFPFLFLGVG